MALLDVLLPPSCAGCGRYGTVICPGCRASLRPLGFLAGDRFLAPDPSLVVGDALILGLAAFAHRDGAQRILRRLKYGGGRRLAGPLAEMALPALRRLLAVTGPATLVPVPLHRSRQRDRGYNQAELLATELARRAGVTVWPALVRRRATERQHGLDRATRVRNLRQAMALSEVPPPEGIQAGGRTVVLVDDILTTGATLEACAIILRAAGMPAVYGFGWLVRCDDGRPGGQVLRYGLPATRRPCVKTTLHARHLELDQRLKARIERKLQRLDRVADPTAHATVELTAKASRAADAAHVAEITLVTKGATLRSTSSAATPMAAVDAVIDQLERQVIRAKERLRGARRSAPPLSRSAASRTVTPTAGEEAGVVEIRRVDMVPMFPEDAITRMEELGQAFFVFLNAQTQRVNVVYRRTGGGHGLIDPVVAP